MVNWVKRQERAGRRFVKQGLKTVATPTVGNIAMLAYRGVQGLRALINSEEFVHDQSLAGALGAGTFLVQHLNGIAQGDGQSQRTGNSLLMSKIQVKDVVSGTLSGIVRIIYFYDKQQISDTAPTGGDVLESSDPQSFYNKLSKGRFQILSDKTMILDTAKQLFLRANYNKKLHKHATYNGPNATDIQKMGLYRLIVSTVPISVQGNSRLGYHDN